jgi:large subunit ribosomal protein L18
MTLVKEKRRLKIRTRIRGKVSGTATKPRLSVFRSNSFIYAQLIDDLTGTTLVSFSSKLLKQKVNKVESSRLAGIELAKLSLAKGISEVVFDRGGYLYHGRVKALAEGAREGGLKF